MKWATQVSAPTLRRLPTASIDISNTELAHNPQQIIKKLIRGVIISAQQSAVLIACGKINVLFINSASC